MTATTVDPPEILDFRGVVLRGISWDAYERLLSDLEKSKQKMYLTYDQGKLGIMPPSPFHEKSKKIIGRFIEAMAMELRISIYALGSTTFKRESLERGLEPDECYYVQHEAEMAMKDDIDLDRDPPPDLAIEMDHTHHPLNREHVYGALGVPEIWQYDGKRLRALKRLADATYEEISTSIAFPFLRIADVENFLTLSKRMTQDQAAHAFRDWIRQTHGRKN